MIKEWIQPVMDAEVPSNLSQLLRQWRTVNAYLFPHITCPILWRVKGGVSYAMLRELPECQRYCPPNPLKTDVGTEDSFVFWIPQLVPRTLGASASASHTVLEDICRQYELPAHHAAFFQSAALVGLLVLGLAQYQYGPFLECARTDTEWQERGGLGVGPFFRGQLFCAFGVSPETIDKEVGAFLIGVEPAPRSV